MAFRTRGGGSNRRAAAATPWTPDVGLDVTFGHVGSGADYASATPLADFKSDLTSLLVAAGSNKCGLLNGGNGWNTGDYVPKVRITYLYSDTPYTENITGTKDWIHCDLVVRGQADSAGAETVEVIAAAPTTISTITTNALGFSEVLVTTTGAHGYSNGDAIYISGVTGTIATELNDTLFRVFVKSSTEFWISDAETYKGYSSNRTAQGGDGTQIQLAAADVNEACGVEGNIPTSTTWCGGYLLRITGGTGSGQDRLVSSYISDDDAGTVVSATANTLRMATSANNVNDSYVGGVITITGGTGSGQSRTVSSYDRVNDTVTVSSNWTTTPDATSTYEIYWRRCTPTATFSPAPDNTSTYDLFPIFTSSNAYTSGGTCAQASVDVGRSSGKKSPVRFTTGFTVERNTGVGYTDITSSFFYWSKEGLTGAPTGTWYPEYEWNTPDLTDIKVIFPEGLAGGDSVRVTIPAARPVLNAYVVLNAGPSTVIDDSIVATVRPGRLTFRGMDLVDAEYAFPNMPARNANAGFKNLDMFDVELDEVFIGGFRSAGYDSGEGVDRNQIVWGDSVVCRNVQLFDNGYGSTGDHNCYHPFVSHAEWYDCITSDAYRGHAFKPKVRRTIYVSNFLVSDGFFHPIRRANTIQVPFDWDWTGSEAIVFNSKHWRHDHGKSGQQIMGFGGRQEEYKCNAENPPYPWKGTPATGTGRVVNGFPGEEVLVHAGTGGTELVLSVDLTSSLNNVEPEDVAGLGQYQSAATTYIMAFPHDGGPPVRIVGGATAGVDGAHFDDGDCSWNPTTKVLTITFNDKATLPEPFASRTSGFESGDNFSFYVNNIDPTKDYGDETYRAAINCPGIVHIEAVTTSKSTFTCYTRLAYNTRTSAWELAQYEANGLSDWRAPDAADWKAYVDGVEVAISGTPSTADGGKSYSVTLTNAVENAHVVITAGDGIDPGYARSDTGPAWTTTTRGETVTSYAGAPTNWETQKRAFWSGGASFVTGSGGSHVMFTCPVSPGYPLENDTSLGVSARLAWFPRNWVENFVAFSANVEDYGSLGAHASTSSSRQDFRINICNYRSPSKYWDLGYTEFPTPPTNNIPTGTFSNRDKSVTLPGFFLTEPTTGLIGAGHGE